jgi:mRNA interferase YafQ
LLILKPSTQFKKDIKKPSGSGSFKMSELKRVLDQLQKEMALDPLIHRPHKLVGNWQGYVECHIMSISSDWLLIFKIDKKQKTLNLARTGTHSELFG